jgi:hypothetical protein
MYPYKLIDLGTVLVGSGPLIHGTWLRPEPDTQDSIFWMGQSVHSQVKFIN